MDKPIDVGKLIPKNHILWVSNYDKDKNLKSFITSDQARTKYFLYEVKDGTANRIATSKVPIFDSSKK